MRKKRVGRGGGGGGGGTTGICSYVCVTERVCEDT